MAEVVGVLRNAALLQIRQIERASSRLPSGRGGQLRFLLLHAVERFDVLLSQYDRELETISQTAMPEAAAIGLRANVAQKFERLGQQLHVTYQLLNTYKDSVGRTDVPIGLQHLLGVVLQELATQPADPIVHPDPHRMYSTKDLVELLDELLTRPGDRPFRDSYTGPHPIVFNLPALDPSNALLSPVIAHEVGHTAVEETLRAELGTRIDADVQQLLQHHLPNLPQPVAERVRGIFRAWCGELICDAVALIATGPAFALAFASFAPPGSTAGISTTHPSVSDRVGFHLQILDELGWTPLIVRRLPTIHAWFTEISASPLLAGDNVESFLRAAMTRVATEVTDIARGHVDAPLDPIESDALLDTLVKSVTSGIPAVEVGETVAGPWQIILAGWIAAINPDYPAGEQLLDAADNDGLNALLIKSLELSSIVTSWRQHDRSGS
ncbi:MAG TPA: hypothetical protein VNR37_07335 [Microbacteriaceae bacterium]|nr:hypothetical protein [Microbacteriaceae bacterium]